LERISTSGTQYFDALHQSGKCERLYFSYEDADERVSRSGPNEQEEGKSIWKDRRKRKKQPHNNQSVKNREKKQEKRRFRGKVARPGEKEFVVKVRDSYEWGRRFAGVLA